MDPSSVTARRQVAAYRLGSLGLAGPVRAALAGDPLAAVTRLGAMQAQDLAGGLWSIGVRTGGTVADVLAAIERREITRVWPMRGTLHWVPARDARWMSRTLSGPSVRAAGRVFAGVGLTDAIVERAGALWDLHLSRAGAMTRAEALAVLTAAGVDVSGQRGYYLLVRHCQTSLLCQGMPRRSPSGALEPTFVRHDDWVTDAHDPSPQEAMSRIAERFVLGHAPVTERDLARWCDQPLGVVREALAACDGRVRTARIAGADWLIHDSEPDPADTPKARPGAEVLLLPGFDEWLLGYGDRSAQLTLDEQRIVVPGGNGVFRGTVVAGSLVVGTWRRVGSGGARTPRLTVQVTPFASLPRGVTRALGGAAAAYGRFLGLPEDRVDVRVGAPIDQPHDG